MSGTSSSTSGTNNNKNNNNSRFWTRRRWQSNSQTNSPTFGHPSASSSAGYNYFETAGGPSFPPPPSSSSSHQEAAGDYFQGAQAHGARAASSPREQRYRVLRRVSSAISPASPTFGATSSSNGQVMDTAAHSPISPLTPEALKRRATRLGSLIGKGRRDDVTRPQQYSSVSRDQFSPPAALQSYSIVAGEQPRSAPSGITSFDRRSSATSFGNNQRFSSSSSQSYYTRTDFNNDSNSNSIVYQRSSIIANPYDYETSHSGHAVPSAPALNSRYSYSQPHDLHTEAPLQHIVSVQTYPPPTSTPRPMSRRPSTPPRSHPRRPSEQSDGFQDASELAAFVEATAALSFFPDTNSRRSSVTNNSRPSARALIPSPSHRPSSSRSAASPARRAAPLPPLPNSNRLSGAHSPAPSHCTPSSQPRRTERLGSGSQTSLPLPPDLIPSPTMQRSTSYASTFAHNPSIAIEGDGHFPTATPTTPATPEGVLRSGSTTSDLTQARSRSPYRFNLPSRTLTDIAPPPTRRPQPGHNASNNIITRSQALAEALQGMDADDESLATGQNGGNLHDIEAAAGGRTTGAGGGGADDDELPDYATSQMEYAARQRWEAALRARELDEAWRRGRGRGLR